MSKKVLYVTNMWPTHKTPWLGTFVKTQVDSLNDIGLDIDVYNISSKKSEGSNLNYIKAVIYLFFKLLKGKYDCIHLQHWICWVVVLPVFWVRKVYTVHEGEFFLGGYRKFFINLAIKFSSKVIFVNQYMYREYIKRDESNNDKYFFIPCGVDEAKFYKLGRDECKKKLGLRADKKYIFFPASPYRKEKNAAFLEAWNERYNGCENCNVEIIWGGSISYDLMPTWMSASHCVLTLGDYESDGMVVKESISCGTPVISFDVGNSNLYIESEQCGTVIKRNLAELDKAITKVITLEESDKSLLNHSYNLVNTAHSVKAVYSTLARSQ